MNYWLLCSERSQFMWTFLNNHYTGVYIYSCKFPAFWVGKQFSQNWNWGNCAWNEFQKQFGKIGREEIKTFWKIYTPESPWIPRASRDFKIKMFKEGKAVGLTLYHSFVLFFFFKQQWMPVMCAGAYFSCLFITHGFGKLFSTFLLNNLQKKNVIKKFLFNFSSLY